MTAPMHCRSYKPAQYVCITKNCKHKVSFLCADPGDFCKQDHQSCSLVSWNFLLKKVSQLQQTQEKVSKSSQLQNVYMSLLSAVKEVQHLMNRDQKNSQMKQLIESPYITAEKKTKISQFINQNMIQPQNLDQQHPSARKIEVQLDDTRMRIIEFFKLMRELRRQKQQNNIQKQQTPSKAQNSSQLLQRSKICSSKSKSKKHLQGKFMKMVTPQPVKSSIPRQSPQLVGHFYQKIKIQETGKEFSPAKSKIKFNTIKKSVLNDQIGTVLRNHTPKGPLFSRITNDVATIYDLFYQKFTKSQLLYRASQNDFLVSKFHESCDGKGQTLTIVLTEFDKIIGGYTPLPWKSGGGDWYQDLNGQSFLFSLTLGEKYPLLYKQKAIWCSKIYGPSFGQPDLEIADRAIHNENSFAKFPVCYNNGNYAKNAQSAALFCGSKTGSFKILQWEVYQLEFA